MVSERALALFNVYRELYGDEPQGLNMHAVALKVIELVRSLGKEPAVKILSTISLMHNYEEITFSFEEKIWLEHLLGEIKNPSEEVE